MWYILYSHTPASATWTTIDTPGKGTLFVLFQKYSDSCMPTIIITDLVQDLSSFGLEPLIFSWLPAFLFTL